MRIRLPGYCWWLQWLWSIPAVQCVSAQIRWLLQNKKNVKFKKNKKTTTRSLWAVIWSKDNLRLGWMFTFDCSMTPSKQRLYMTLFNGCSCVVTEGRTFFKIIIQNKNCAGCWSRSFTKEENHLQVDHQEIKIWSIHKLKNTQNLQVSFCTPRLNSITWPVFAYWKLIGSYILWHNNTFQSRVQCKDKKNPKKTPTTT